MWCLDQRCGDTLRDVIEMSRRTPRAMCGSLQPCEPILIFPSLPFLPALLLQFHLIFTYSLSLSSWWGLGTSAPQPGVEPVAPAVEVQSPNPRTSREFFYLLPSKSPPLYQPLRLARTPCSAATKRFKSTKLLVVTLCLEPTLQLSPLSVMRVVL